MFGVVINTIRKVVELNGADSCITRAKHFHAFECVREPGIDIVTFFSIFKPYVESGEWVVTLVLVNRLLKKSEFKLGIYNVHRLVFTALLVTLKHQRGSDKERFNQGFANLIQMDRTDVAKMEIAFLSLIDWNLHVTSDEYAHAVVGCMQMVSQPQ
eukprot:Hpha_TRINITY_DN15370_c1_g6::TRINITY_DN15370_c1_g6_i1::g.87383::m.87383